MGNRTGSALREAVKKWGTQRRFAAKLRVTQQSLTFWMQGKRTPTLHHQKRIFDLVGVRF